MINKKIITLLTLLSITVQPLGSLAAHASTNESPLFAFKEYNFETKETTYDETKPSVMNKYGEQVTIPNEFINPKEQFRTAWLSTVVNIDIASVDKDANLSAEDEFKNQMTEILDNFVNLNLNAVTFQVSPMLDAWYPSDIVPWSQYLHTDTAYTSQGVDPGFGDFNPLEWLIQETHNRGMEFHAWFNPYRVTNHVDTRPVADKLNDLAENNFAKLHPEYVYEFQNKLFLDPGINEVMDFIIDRIEEVAVNYDVDAIHFDDYFYPYKYTDANGVDQYFHDKDLDKATFENYNREFGEYNLENAAAWREENINILMRRIKGKINQVNNATDRAVQFGVSPFGIWGHEEDLVGGSVTPLSSTSSLRDQFANTKLWAQEGLLDYLTPQVYWAFGTAAAPYGELVEWWDGIFENIPNSHLYIGHPNYKYIDASWDANFKNPSEIGNQLRFNQKYSNVKGSGFFSYAKLKPHTVVAAGDKFDILNESNEIIFGEYFNLSANVPGKTWLDKVDTVAVTNPTYDVLSNGNKLTWVDTNTDSKFYVVYRQEGNTVDITNPANILTRFGVDLGTKYFDETVELGKTYTYAVTVVDKASVENAETVFNLETLEAIKKLVSDSKEADALIAALPSVENVTLENEQAVLAARVKVNTLSSKEYLVNLDKLTALENRIESLKIEAAEKAAADKAAADKAAADKAAADKAAADKAAAEKETVDKELQETEKENALPQTGGTSSLLLLSLAGALTVGGTVLAKKKKQD